MGTSLEETQRTKHHNKISIRMVGDGSKKWGASNHCPACDRTVYPSEQVFGADRKPWHRQCIKCSIMGCPNELYERGFFRSPQGGLVCESCHEALFAPREYGPPPGMESLEERRARALREAEERERKLREIESKRGRKDSFGNTPSIYCMKIAETCEIAPDQVYSL